MSEPLLKMRNIHKRFPGVHALKGVQLDIMAGEVHALLGENGAGKSTLIKVLAGIHQPDEGEIIHRGKPCEINSVFDSQAKGISVIHQEICLVPYMTVSENFYLGREEVKDFSRKVNAKSMDEQTQALLNQLGLNIDAQEIVAYLSIAQQQMVEIAKALLFESEIIIMDEPTASLTNKEVDMLFDTIEKLKKKNISIIYISHRMEEIFRVSDRVTVMRDGEYIDTVQTKETTKEHLIKLMVGRDLENLYSKTRHIVGKTVLELKNLKNKNVYQANINVKQGEILGIAGLVGAGRTELARMIFGIDAIDEGEIFVEGKLVQIHNPLDAMKHGIALVPENRKEEGLVLINSVGFNISLPVLDQVIEGMSINEKKETELNDYYIKHLSIKTPNTRQLANNLSGGNQQKIVIAKWLATKPKVLILDEPTRGVDVGAKAEIYSIINRLAEEGVGIIMISSELPEIINMSDRVIVMREGHIMGELERDELDQEQIMQLATGGISKNAS
jgi:ribose transport system ATP-binding protein/inositol transport system ATP-binding protein